MTSPQNGQVSIIYKYIYVYLICIPLPSTSVYSILFNSWIQEWPSVELFTFNSEQSELVYSICCYTVTTISLYRSCPPFLYFLSRKTCKHSCSLIIVWSERIWTIKAHQKEKISQHDIMHSALYCRPRRNNIKTCIDILHIVKKVDSLL